MEFKTCFVVSTFNLRYGHSLFTIIGYIGWVTDYGVEAGVFAREDLGEFFFPVEGIYSVVFFWVD